MGKFEFFKVVDCFNSHELEQVINSHINGGWLVADILESKSEFFHVYSVHFLKKKGVMIWKKK
ncbi:MAG: hypothetical protein ACOX1V_02025 [Candidatus Iainarchaeum sp.]